MSYPLGIDFGTTFSSCSVFLDNEVKFIVDDETGKPSIPSVLFWSDNGFLFGRAAENMALLDPTRVCRWFKRRLNDRVPISLGSRQFYAVELVGEVFRVFREKANQQYHVVADEVVATCPATYGDKERERLKESAIAAGFKKCYVVDEPVAAAQSFFFDLIQVGVNKRFQAGEHLLIYDLGGGTFDASLYRVGESLRFDIVHVPVGDPFCGGLDFNEALLDLCLSKSSEKLKEIFRDGNQDSSDLAVLRLRATILDQVIAIKHLLSSQDHAIFLDFANNQVSVRIERYEYESMIQGLIENTVNLCKEMVSGSGIRSAALAGILLIGGSSRTPLVSKCLRSLGASIYRGGDMDLCVARGAAIWGLQEVQQREIIQSLGLDQLPERFSEAEYRSILKKAGQAYGLQQFTLAKALFERLWLSRSTDPWPMFGLGLCSSREGDHRNAALILERALQLDPKNADLNWGLGVTLFALGRVDEAKKAQLSALSLKPGHEGALQELRRIAYASV